MAEVVLALDQGTSGGTALAVGLDGRVIGRGHRELTQHFPRPGWVEHDAGEIWSGITAAAAEALARAGSSPAEVRAVGIANQRETLVLWDRRRLHPLHRAIVWQDRRTADVCRRLSEAGHDERVRRLTGLVIDPYFTGTKLAWAMTHVEGARDAAAGTVDSWLVARLSGGRDHLTDASNASRTLLFDIDRGGWSEELAELLGVPIAVLPRVVDSSGPLSRTDPGAFLGIDAPISGIAGDQQAALFGQACTEPGMAKNTYGTGSFLLLQTGSRRVDSAARMLTTVAWQLGGRLSYALEGAIFATGAAIQWLRDGLGLIAGPAEVEPLAASVPDSGGVFLVPAFTGLGAPWWDPRARAALLGLTRGSGRGHIARAAIESIAFQVRDVADAMEADAGALRELRVDGGAAVNDLLCQFQADLLGIPVRRPRMVETTGLGAALLAGRGAGIWAGDAGPAALWELDREFEPRISRDQADALQAGWRRAVRRTLDWDGDDGRLQDG